MLIQLVFLGTTLYHRRNQTTWTKPQQFENKTIVVLFFSKVTKQFSFNINYKLFFRKMISVDFEISTLIKLKINSMIHVTILKCFHMFSRLLINCHKTKYSTDWPTTPCNVWHSRPAFLMAIRERHHGDLFVWTPTRNIKMETNFEQWKL